MEQNRYGRNAAHDNDDMVRKLQEIAAEYSDANVTITIREDSVWFEKMDEQSKVFD